MTLMRMNHDQWPPVDPPGVEMDPPAWMLIPLLAVLAIPLLISAGVNLLYERWRQWR